MLGKIGRFEYEVRSLNSLSKTISSLDKHRLSFLHCNRMKLLQIAMDERHKVLINAGANQNILLPDGSRPTNNGTIGPLPNLSSSVKSPWERATTASNVPYYIE